MLEDGASIIFSQVLTQWVEVDYKMKVNHAQFEIRNQEQNIFCREIAFQIRRIPSTTQLIALY